LTRPAHAYAHAFTCARTKEYTTQLEYIEQPFKHITYMHTHMHTHHG